MTIATVFAGALQYVDINSRTVVEAEEFEECVSLKQIKCENVISIGDAAFQGCETLICFSTKQTPIIGNIAFEFCKRLQTVKLGKYRIDFSKEMNLDS